MMNRKVLITGASRGIGRAIAESFAKAGDELILTCINSVDELRLYAKELSDKYDITCRAFACDAGDYDSVKELFGGIDDIDIVVNNAGVAFLGLLTDMEKEDWRRLLSTNLDSLYNTSKFAIPMMVKKQSGKIINISSVWGEVGASCEVAYSASKGGVNSFTKALAKELAPSGIQVNAIACGVIDTDMNRKHLSEDDIKELEEEIPMGRMGEVQEVADLALMIADAPAYMTGQIITLDGGWI
ncbi:SDR family oxidoreductase [Butyrivibrio sp. X503]|uniref:elongation factor P 5-aminopentanone reductase n=1 Tax=Butyrivibrio sp. X503 TaxID=2364878 RepID=UPI000EA93AFE|nr:SDR family oxidoreductase [Butyrivibrio sp. X503]RKM58293.1 SDR family oxidoreductase [Butyrivibrio sp. X503]